MSAHLSLGSYDLIILDIDGTILDTPHFEAWRRAADTVLSALTSRASVSLTEGDYLTRVAGLPRPSGARAILEIAGVTPTDRLTQRLADIKQEEFLRIRKEARLFPDARSLLRRAADRRAPVAFYTASKNAPDLLARCFGDLPGGRWLTERLWASVRATQTSQPASRREHLQAVADRFCVRPSSCLVIDDALHAIKAAKDAGMSAVLMDRVGRGGSACDVLSIPTLDGIRLPPSISGDDSTDIGEGTPS